MTFANLLGNEPIKTYLSRALETGCLHHTILFSGPDGIGKSLFAKALAQNLLESSVERVQNEIHPDLHLLRPESKSGTHLVEQLRDMIEEVHKPPFEAKQKVFIIYDAHRMLSVAANMLLKTFEEPNLDCQIVLISSSPGELLATIRSRCIHLIFQPISEDQISSFLQRKYSMDSGRSLSLARLSMGSLSHALELMQNDWSEKVGRILIDAMEKKISPTQAIEEIEGLFSDLEGIAFHQQAELLIATYLMWTRDQELKLSSGDARLLYFSQTTPASPVSLARAQVHAAKVKIALERNVKFSACLDFLLNQR
jgi:DNA polymerase III gamma/tau subunit